MLGSSFFKNIFTERSCHIFGEQSLFSEQAERIGIKNFCPFVAVVSCTIATCKQMPELGAHARSFDYRKYLCFLPCLFFKFFYIAFKWLFQRVPCHIQKSKAQLTNREIACKKILRIFNFFH